MTSKIGQLAGVAALVALIAGTIFYLQNFDATKIACEDIPQARIELQTKTEEGIQASVDLFKQERIANEERLSQCLRAEPEDPCASEQAARDAAYKAFFDIPEPKENAPYADFQDYYQKRDEAYNAYKTAKAALDQCRAANPPKGDVPYEESDTKACFDAYDAADKEMQDTFTRDTQAMRSALQAALSALDAREKACNPPTGSDDKFTLTPGTGPAGEDYAENIASCRLIDENADAELRALRQRVAEITAEIESVDTTLANAGKKTSALRVDLSNVDTYIPPESSKTQFEAALNALRGQRKANLESSLEYYQKLVERKQEERTKLQQNLRDTEARIAERIAEIQRENQMRKQKYPTTLHLAPPDKCAYYHCHGMICGIPDAHQDECGQGVTDEADTECKAFFDAYLKAAGGS